MNIASSFLSSTIRILNIRNYVIVDVITKAQMIIPRLIKELIVRAADFLDRLMG